MFIKIQIINFNPFLSFKHKTCYKNVLIGQELEMLDPRSSFSVERSRQLWTDTAPDYVDQLCHSSWVSLTSLPKGEDTISWTGLGLHPAGQLAGQSETSCKSGPVSIVQGGTEIHPHCWRQPQLSRWWRTRR